MILKTKDGGNLKIAASAGEWGTESWIPTPGVSRLSQAGVPVTEDATMGLPAVASVIRSAADIIASIPFATYRGIESERAVARDSWQWERFHENPDPTSDVDSFQFFYDLIISLEAAQEAFILKAKYIDTETYQSELAAVQVIDPLRVITRVEDGEKLFDVYSGPGYGDVIKDLTTDDILHIRGYARRPGSCRPTRYMEESRDTLGNAIGMQKFEGDFYRNYAQPPFFFVGASSKQQANDWVDNHNAQHRGVGAQHKVGALWGQADIKTIPISMKEALFIEGKNMSIEDICRIWRWPRALVEIGEVRESVTDFNVLDSHLTKFYILPRLRRIERAFAQDKDVYFGTDLYGEFLIAGLERGDVHTRYDAYRLARQGGWVTANELRQFENLPPHPDGDQLQITPVGGAPNAANQQVAAKMALHVLEALAEHNGNGHYADRIEALKATINKAEVEAGILRGED